jgi:hypothetical protein
MEIKFSVFRELLEEELKESIDIFGSSVCVTGTITTIRIANIQRLKGNSEY